MTRKCFSVVVTLMFGIGLVSQTPSPAAVRTVLLERFTQWNCSGCATQNSMQQPILQAMGRDTVVAIWYHVWWPAPNDDVFYLWNTAEVQFRKAYYGISYIPCGYLDGTTFVDYNVTATWFRNNIRSRKSVPAVCTMDVHAWASGTTAVGYCVTVTAEQAITDRWLFVALITDYVHYATAPGTNGERDFYDTFRDMSPNTTGWSVTIGAGEDSTYSGTLNREASWAPADLSVVAFVQNTATKEVLQAGWSDVNTDAPVLLAVSDLIANYTEEDGGLRLTWTHLIETTAGCPLSGRRYVVYRNTVPGFEPQPADSVGGTTDSTFVDTSVLANDKGFYCVRVISE